MPSKSKNERPAPELRNGQVVEKILKLRMTPLPGTQVAKKMGYAKNRLVTMLARIRWMAKVKLGGDCPIGKVEQKVAREFLKVWDAVEPPRGKLAQGWKPAFPGSGPSAAGGTPALTLRRLLDYFRSGHVAHVPREGYQQFPLTSWTW